MATLLGAVLYDPATAANKATTAALAMTVLDATNLTLAITVPASGIIRVVMRTVLDGATTFPQVLLGVMNHSGGAILGRVQPMATLAGTALATTRVQLTADFIITGLTPGALQLDAAYGVELLVAATAIRWGGPNNTTASDAWGAFNFEIWDPNGMPGITAGWLTAAGIASGALNGKGDWNIGKTGYAISATGLNLQTAWTVAITGNITGNLSGSVGSVTGAVGSVTGNVGGSVASVTGAVGSVTGNVGGNVTGSVGSVATGGITAASIATGAVDADAIAADAVTEIQAGLSTLTAANVRSALGMASANLDTQLAAIDDAVDTEIAALTTSVAAIKLQTDNLPSDPADASVVAGLIAGVSTKVDTVDTVVDAIKVKTDSLTYTVAGKLDANMYLVKGQTITGAGTEANPWGP